MMPRLIGRTHYQVDEPRFVDLLVNDCTSPIAGQYRERVASKLLNTVIVERRYRKEFNLSAAKYAVDLARGLQVMDDNHVWTDRGHLVFLARSTANCDSTFELTRQEQLVFFRLFLTEDGAALVYLARRLLGENTLLTSRRDWNRLANEMETSVLKSYLAIATDTYERFRIRESLERRRRNPYKGRSGEHQTFIHLQTLVRLGLIEKEGHRRYIVGASETRHRLATFASAVPDVVRLEHSVAANDWLTVAQQVWEPDGPISSEMDFLRSFAHGYNRLESQGIRMVPIEPIVEWIQIESLARGQTPTPRDVAADLLKKQQAAKPRSIRFHVDRAGRMRYAKIDPDTFLSD